MSLGTDTVSSMATCEVLRLLVEEFEFERTAASGTLSTPVGPKSEGRGTSWRALLDWSSVAGSSGRKASTGCCCALAPKDVIVLTTDDLPALTFLRKLSMVLPPTSKPSPLVFRCHSSWTTLAAVAPRLPPRLLALLLAPPLLAEVLKAALSLATPPTRWMACRQRGKRGKKPVTSLPSDRVLRRLPLFDNVEHPVGPGESWRLAAAAAAAILSEHNGLEDRFSAKPGGAPTVTAKAEFACMRVATEQKLLGPPLFASRTPASYEDRRGS